MSEWLRRRSFLYWYWSGLLHGRFRLWQILGLGTLWIAVGIGLHLFLRAKSGSGSSTTLAALCACGVFHYVLAAKAVALQKRLDPYATDDDGDDRRGADAVAKASERTAKARVEPPRATPTVDATPFRAAPRPPPIAVVNLGSAAPAASAPVVSDVDPASARPDDKPKLLT